jgi:hypothetical protein
MIRWGLWDTKDSCWLGDGNGPFTFKSHRLAQLGAQVAEDMMTGSDLAGRIQCKEFAPGVLRLKDHLHCLHTAEESLGRLEGEEPPKPS